MADILHDLVNTQAKAAEEAVNKADFSGCPVPGQREVQLFQIRALRAILENQNGKRNQLSFKAAGAGAGFVVGVEMALKFFGVM